MHAFTTLAVLALAASTVSPVLSAPVRDNQAQAQAELEERFSFGPLLQEIGKQGALGSVFGLFQNILGGSGNSNSNSSARDFSEEERRGFGSLGTFGRLNNDQSLGTVSPLKNGQSLLGNILGGVASAIGSSAIGTLFNRQNNDKRTPEPGNPLILSQILGRSDIPPGVLAALGLVDKRSEPEELLAALNSILRRAVNELD